MLQGDIQIFADVLVTTNHFQQIDREIIRVRIMQANPFHPFNLSHSVNQFSNTLLAIQVNAIECQFLGNNLELLHAFMNKTLHFPQNILHGSAHMLSRNDRYGAIGAFPVASFRDFDIRIVGRSCHCACLHRITSTFHI